VHSSPLLRIKNTFIGLNELLKRLNANPVPERTLLVKEMLKAGICYSCYFLGQNQLVKRY
jgi:hypothetical protein